MLTALLGGAPVAGAHAVPAGGTPCRKGVTAVLCSLQSKVSLPGGMFWVDLFLS